MECYCSKCSWERTTKYFTFITEFWGPAKFIKDTKPYMLRKDLPLLLLGHLLQDLKLIYWVACIFPFPFFSSSFLCSSHSASLKDFCPLLLLLLQSVLSALFLVTLLWTLDKTSLLSWAWNSSIYFILRFVYVNFVYAYVYVRTHTDTDTERGDMGSNME